METSLHRQLKLIYAGVDAQCEQRVGAYRIDAVRDGELIEIQHGSLSAIRTKIVALTAEHRVRVVKPLIARKYLVKLDAKNGRPVSRRLSPKVCDIWSLFDELVYFTTAFPHANLTLEAPLVEVEEIRYPGHGRRRRWRKNDFQVQDQRLVSVQESQEFRSAADLLRLLPASLPQPFHTGHLAEHLNVKRWIAQRVAYCLRKTAAVEECGKQGNSVLYAFPRSAKRKKRSA